MLLIAWAMEQGECKKFEVGGCSLEGGFDSEEECQRACKGQDYILWGQALSNIIIDQLIN